MTLRTTRAGLAINLKQLITLAILAVLSAASLLAAGSGRADGSGPEKLTPLTAYAAPDTFTYGELVEFERAGGPPNSLLSKLDALLTTPFVSNEALLTSDTAELSQSDLLGQYIRVGFWNVERGTNLDDMRLALLDPEQFKSRMAARPDTKKHREAVEQIEVLRSVDVLALNEADLGLKRTGYRDVARELAAALKMNYTYGVEFVEIDPVNLGTEEFSHVNSGERRARLRQTIEVDRARYRGLHGTAVLSKFPILRARLVPLKCQPYDWYSDEKKRISLAESARRQLGKHFFLEEVPREIRYGGRSVLIAELAVPQLPEGRLTVVATHLESRCKPSERREQLNEVLSLIKDIGGPVILTGDLNTSGSSQRPTTIGKEVMNRIGNKKFWTKQGVKALVPFGFAVDFLMEAVTYARTSKDPTAKSIVVFAPNKEAAFFDDLERFRFDDGFAFDFRGDPDRTVNGTRGTLANSNHRSQKKGFISTHATRRTFWPVGKSKLDWIFVKAYAKDARGRGEPYRLAPHFARTLKSFNYSLGKRLSDHDPLTVDLPIEEPHLK